VKPSEQRDQRSSSCSTQQDRCGTDSRLELTRLGGPDLSPYESTCTYETLVDMGSKFSLGRLILTVIIRRLTNTQTEKRGAYHAKFRQFVVQKLQVQSISVNVFVYF
jgi:hypothetical protein